MSQLTRNGICYDLEVSPFTIERYYNDHSIVVQYVFSSELYTNKFTEKQNKNRDSINQSLSKRFGLNIQNDLLADINLYSKIEKRGFLIFINGAKVKCLKSITLDGKNPIIKN